MRLWRGKSSSKEAKRKENREHIFDTIQQKLQNAPEEKCNNKSGRTRKHHDDLISNNKSTSLAPSRSSSPIAHVSRCQSFEERPLSQPLPLPRSHLPTAIGANSGVNLTSKLERAIDTKPSLYFPLPKPNYVSNKEDPKDAERDITTASISSDSSIDSGSSFDSPHLVSPLASDCENGNRATINSSFSVVRKNQSLITFQRNSRASPKPAPPLCNNKPSSTSPIGAPLHKRNLQIAHPGGLCSSSDSAVPSPSRSTMGAYGPDKVLNSELWTGKPYLDIASGHCYSLVCGHNSGHNAVGGDLLGQMIWPQNRCSPECSPIPSPRIKSPAPTSRIQRGIVTPVNPKAGGAAAEVPTRRPDDVKQKHIQLPPTIKVTKCPISPTFSASTTPSAPHSPATSENLTSPSSRWKKGQLLGRGTFGHVYLGFNRESGEMCAMKEVTLFSDDAKSRESAKQLSQEIAMLSRLRHPNIVQYYGSEMVDDKLYVYLEYVSGGSIYKLVKDYGQLGEIAIRNYTRQILLGLTYLHAKNTVHRDIKGANILVDPSGQIKLADFGMAKHISGSSCPFSFKGSPYWMAPEVIKNSSGCNLAVDIWSLGCTVLEMATTKPPWSQFEGVAAMFKIGNSKELPTIPDHLSEDGKDFVRLCLQRNPLNRPSAARLLEHPFVKNAMLERSILTVVPSEDPTTIINAVRSLAIGPAKHNLCLDSEVAGIYPHRSLRTGSGSSDALTPRNISCPVSPSLPYKSSHTSRRMSHSPISSFHTSSGSSSPLNSGSGAIPFHQTKQPIFSHEVVGMIQKSKNGAIAISSTAYGSSSPLPLHQTKQPLFSHEVVGMIQKSQNGAILISSPHTASGSSSPLTIGNGAIPFHQTKQPLFSHEVVGMIQKSQNRAIPISSPRSASGSSFTLAGGGGAIPSHLTKQPLFSHETVGMIQKPQNGFYSDENTTYQGSKHEHFGRNLQTTHACQDVLSSDNDALPNRTRTIVQGDPMEFRDGKLYLVDCVSQQLLRDYVRLNACLDLKPDSPNFGRMNSL